MHYIDTHCHLDGEEFDADREAVMQRAREAGCKAIFVPAIDLKTSQRILDVCSQHPGFLYPMVGLHPEEVRQDWQEQLQAIHSMLSGEGYLVSGEWRIDSSAKLSSTHPSPLNNHHSPLT